MRSVGIDFRITQPNAMRYLFECLRFCVYCCSNSVIRNKVLDGIDFAVASISNLALLSELLNSCHLNAKYKSKMSMAWDGNAQFNDYILSFSRRTFSCLFVCVCVEKECFSFLLLQLDEFAISDDDFLYCQTHDANMCIHSQKYIHWHASLWWFREWTKTATVRSMCADAQSKWAEHSFQLICMYIYLQCYRFLMK